MSKASDLARLLTSGSTSLHGEAGVTASGSTGLTTNLQQGLAKAWVKHNAAAALQDSLNISSGTDTGTGDYTFVFTSNMTNAEYGLSGAASLGSGNVPVVSWNPRESGQTTSDFDVELGYTSTIPAYTYFDAHGGGLIHGDLA